MSVVYSLPQVKVKIFYGREKLLHKHLTAIELDLAIANMAYQSVEI